MKEIIITAQDKNIRAAVLEDGRLVEVLDDIARETRLAGSIFLGKIKNIVPGMQAAFVDIGLGKNAFLYAGDAVIPGYDGEKKILPRELPGIERLFREGQEVTVQVIREPAGSKGARVSAILSLPGRYAVLLPGMDHLRISRKITDEKERERLMEAALRAKPEKAGLIIRTLAEGIAEKELIEDIKRLSELEEEIRRRIRQKSSPGPVFSGSDPFSRLLRETIDNEVDKIIIDDGELAEQLRRRLKELSCPAAGRVWTDFRGDLFERYNVNQEIRRALQPKVRLESGGYLVIEQTEALSSIDVNTGKYTGNKSVAETLLHINLEAAVETARQIRLRNLTGIIIVDFIDMENSEDWDKVLKTLETSLAKDRAKCRLMGLTRLGLVELTRKKEGQPLAVRYKVRCENCGGEGWVMKNN